MDCSGVTGSLPAVPVIEYYLTRDPLVITLGPITMSNSQCQVTYSIDIPSAPEVFHLFNA